MSRVAIFLVLLLSAVPAAAQVQQDCRAPGNIGTALMAADGTITLTLQTPDGTGHALAYHKGDPNYPRMLAHIGGMQPGEHKAVPAFCH